MNTFKKFLVLGSTLVCMTSYNIANCSSQCNSINKSGLISGGMSLSNCDTVITKSLEVQNNDFGKGNHNKLAEVRFGKQNRNTDEPNTNVILASAGKLIQNKNGHIHVFNNMDVREGANIFTTEYNRNHISTDGKSIKDSNLGIKDTAGFDIHGDGKDPNSGFIKFHKGSNIKLVGSTITSTTQLHHGINNNSSGISTTTGQMVSQHNHHQGANNSCTCCSCCCCVETHTGSESGNGQSQDQTSGQTSDGTQGQTSGSTSTSSNNHPALYLCNANSRVDISEVLQKTYKPSGSEDEVTQNFKIHIVGTTDNDGNRQGTVDIFDLNGSNSSEQTTSDSILGNIDEQLDNIGNNDVICDNVKINIPSYKIQVVDGNGNTLDQSLQQIKVTALEPAINSGTEENPKYDTVNGTDKFIGATISLVDEQGKPITKFLPGDLIEILKESYIDNSNPDYTLLKKKGAEGNGTGIKIVPPISDENDISKIFDTNSNAKLIKIKNGETDKRVTIPEFIRSIRSSNDNSLKLNVYKESGSNKYMICNDFLNDPKYTLDLDKFNDSNTIPFKLNPPVGGDKPYIDMDGYNDSDVLPLYVNLKGETNKRLKMPTKNEGEDNQINEIDFLGNNTKFTGMIGIMEKQVSFEYDTYVKKIVFDKDSYVKTDRITNTAPIDWKFIGSNNNVHQLQDGKCYASNINNRLSLMTLDKGNKDKLFVRIDDPSKNKSINGGFNSYIYVDEIFFTNVSEDTDSKKPKTSLVVSDNSTVRLVNKKYANDNPGSIFGTRNVLISHVDSSFGFKNYDNQLDSILKYSPTEKFLKTTNNLCQQLRSYDKAGSGAVEFHVSIDANDFPGWKETVNPTAGIFLLDIMIQKDESDGKNKPQFYNMMEYVYCSEFNDNTSSSSIDLSKKPHLYIPLLLKQGISTCYYYITNFEVFPGYTRDLLKTNLKNAIAHEYNTYDIIPNIYIGGKQISTQSPFEILLKNESNDNYRDGKYLVFKQTITQNTTING